jgi:hypothetical protein
MRQGQTLHNHRLRVPRQGGHVRRRGTPTAAEQRGTGGVHPRNRRPAHRQNSSCQFQTRMILQTSTTPPAAPSKGGSYNTTKVEET